MISKLLAAALLVAAPVPASAPASGYPQVHQVICSAGMRGSAVRISDDTYVTAAHVATLNGCSIDGEPMQVVRAEGEIDFAVLHTERHGHGFPVNCEGFRPGQYYFAIGFAFGWPIQRTVLVRAEEARHITGMAIMVGPELFIPGMSGGAVVDEHGALVGIVNARNEQFHVSFSRDLRDTSACRAPA